MKEGGQVVIAAERERDEQLAQGKVAPVALDVPLPEFRLPRRIPHGTPSISKPESPRKSRSLWRVAS